MRLRCGCVYFFNLLKTSTVYIILGKVSVFSSVPYPDISTYSHQAIHLAFHPQFQLAFVLYTINNIQNLNHPSIQCTSTQFQFIFDFIFFNKIMISQPTTRQSIHLSIRGIIYLVSILSYKIMILQPTISQSTPLPIRGIIYLVSFLSYKIMKSQQPLVNQPTCPF